MTKRLPEKSRVTTVSRVRKTALMGAAATAFMGAARSLYAGVTVEPVTTVQAAVKDALNGPRKIPPRRVTLAATPAAPIRISAIDVDNGEDITVGADETALSRAETVEGVNLTNTGNLTGGIGIEVSTGATNLADAVFDETTSYVVPGRYETLYDMDGNLVYGPDPWPLSAATAEFNYTTRNTILARDPAESTITINNAGSIDFSGNRGIKATNPSGQSISISNSGDITATQETAGRVGIYASTEAFSDTFIDTQTATGEFVRNDNGQLVEVIAPDEFDTLRNRVDMEYDGGAISIHNTGDIDMGAVTGPRLYGASSIGIYARGDGGTTIVNDGQITVDRWSSAIQVATTAGLSITNNGRIDVGNGSHGIATGQSNGNAGDYRLGGDVTILNTGDIFGGVTKDEAQPGDLVFATGMNIFALGSNNEYTAGTAHLNEIFSAYNEALGADVYTLYDIPGTRLYDTTVVNQGHIELKDGGVGMLVMPRAGESTAVNEGTIIVGDGTSIFEANNQQSSAGIFQTNFPFDGLGQTVSINTETGIIVTGDDSAGISNLNIGGISVAINEGSITTGNGVSQLVTDYTGTTFDRLFHSFGIQSVSAGPTIGTYAYALNTGDITVGDLAVGSFVSGHGFPLLDPARITALNVNEGIIETGDSSTGMFAWGTNATAVNTGTITTGNYDISAFVPHPEFTADEFAQLRFGAASSGAMLSEVINEGTITTGDGTIGASAHFTERYSIGVASRVLQSEDGIIVTGDDSIGVRVKSTYYAALGNEGEISTGNNSVGVDLTAGNVLLAYGELEATILPGAISALNDGIIETGDNSVGLRVNGIREDVAYSGRVYVPNPTPPPYYNVVDVAGTADVTSYSYTQNNGTIRVGANSTAVVITGLAASEQGLHIFNTGTIDASLAGSTAISLNAGHDIDSYLVNVGTIAGDIVFGAGDDRLMNTLMVDNAGRVTSSGNIVMNGSTIDFGAGENRFDNDQGTITIAGGDNLITGADLFMTGASIEARNGAVGNTLTIDGNLSGDFVFGADVNGAGDSDQLFITGDVADGSSMGVVLNATAQLSGDTTFTVITVGGQNDGDEPVVAGITGNFADSLQNAEIRYESGEVIVTARFGMGHMATSATAATTMAQHWWMQSAGSLDRRDMQRLAGLEDSGLSVWAATFHEESSIEPGNELQDVSFDQKLSGLQTGIEWKGDLGGGSLSVGPMFSYGNASANQNANLASAMGDASAYGLNASYRFKNGLYLNATWQQMAMEIDFRTPGTFSNATGTTDAEGSGFNVELGYAHRLGSGLTLAPQLQYASVSMDLDDFTTSDDVYTLAQMGGKHSLLRAGLSVFKTFETTHGSITPLMDLSYLDAMDGDSTLSSNGIAFANDTSGSGYRAELGIAGRYKAWDITGRVGLADTTAIKSALTSNLSVRYRW
jgi:outer membrane autotransporter protein